MELKFLTENGTTAVEFSFDAEDRRLLDKQCVKLGLVKSETVRPLGVPVAEPIPFWRDSERNRLRTVVTDKIARSHSISQEGNLELRYTDDVNGALIYKDPDRPVAQINLGLLRLVPETGKVIKLTVSQQILGPEELMSFFRGFTAAYQALVSIVFEAKVKITVAPPSNRTAEGLSAIFG
jgi:hypothetical protein